MVFRQLPYDLPIVLVFVARGLGANFLCFLPCIARWFPATARPSCSISTSKITYRFLPLRVRPQTPQRFTVTAQSTMHLCCDDDVARRRCWPNAFDTKRTFPTPTRAATSRIQSRLTVDRQTSPQLESNSCAAAVDCRCLSRVE